MALDVPAVVRKKAGACGASAWLDDLPALVASLERDWSITVGGVYGDATEALVAEATLLSDGTPAVLKLLIPRDGGIDAAVHEITVLRMTEGEGCVRLLRDDASVGAMLLERLGPSMAKLGLPLRTRHELLCDVAARVWRPAAGCGLPTGAEKGRWLIELIPRLWEELDRPCSERAVDYAVACAERRIAAHDDEHAVLVHGDVHQWNTLQAPDSPVGFKLVDPDGLLADAEYDLGIIMREDPHDGDLGERARWLAARTGLSADAIWGVGSGRARVDRAAVRASRAAAGWRRDARRGRSPRRCGLVAAGCTRRLSPGRSGTAAGCRTRAPSARR